MRLQIGLSRHCSINYLLECLEHFWGHNIFYSIDLYGDEFAQPIEFLKINHIRLNITPTSNVKLGRIQELKTHPIRELYRSGIDLTINSDDILIFDSDISKEYLRLYEAETLTAEELDNIRINGLRRL